MHSKTSAEEPEIPSRINFVSHGTGAPVILIHGLAASLHDWDELVPRLANAGYSVYAPDLLGHGDSPKPDVPAYEMQWMVDHFVQWLNSLRLDEAAVIVGHSLGGYVALEYARRHPSKVRGLILVDPFYKNAQLPALVRLMYAHPAMGRFFTARTPRWLVRRVIDVTSMFMGHAAGGLHALPAQVRAQTATDYLRTAPAAYAMLNADLNQTPNLAAIGVPVLVVWGEMDGTLAPSSFDELVTHLPHAVGRPIRTGHVPHQAQAAWFNEQVMAFLESLPSLATKDDERVRSGAGDR